LELEGAWWRRGNAPIKERERLRREAATAGHAHELVAHQAFEARKAERRDDGKAGRRVSPLGGWASAISKMVWCVDFGEWFCSFGCATDWALSAVRNGQPRRFGPFALNVAAFCQGQYQEP